MPDAPRIIYWDSCVFLNYVNMIPEHESLLEQILENSASDNSPIKIYTSVLAHVEVSFAASEQQNQALDPETERLIGNLWSDPEAIVSVEYHADIGQLATGLMRDAVTRGWSLKPLDAIHLATAQWLSSVGLTVEEFHTYDRGLFRYDSIVGFPILEPRIENPRML